MLLLSTGIAEATLPAGIRPAVTASGDWSTGLQAVAAVTATPVALPLASATVTHPSTMAVTQNGTIVGFMNGGTSALNIAASTIALLVSHFTIS